MNEDELRARITEEILSGLKFETFQHAHLISTICVNVIVDDATSGKHAQAVCRFYTTNGAFIGEIPAKDIIQAQANLSAFK